MATHDINITVVSEPARPREVRHQGIYQGLRVTSSAEYFAYLLEFKNGHKTCFYGIDEYGQTLTPAYYPAAGRLNEDAKKACIKAIVNHILI